MNGRDIIVTTEAGVWPDDSEAVAGRSAAAVLTRLLGSHPGDFEVGITLSDDATVQDLNHRYRGKDRPTNVLSFPMADSVPDPDQMPDHPVMLGDLILAAETVAAEAAVQGKAGSDHLAHLVVHGMLHLFGHDHQADAEAGCMERLETELLAGLGIADPYAGVEADSAGSGTPERPHHDTARQ